MLGSGLGRKWNEGQAENENTEKKGGVVITKGLKAWKKISKVSFTWLNLNGGVIIALSIKLERNMGVFCRCEIRYLKVILN